MATFDLHLRTRATLFVDGEPSDFITTHTGEVICSADDGEETVAGHVRALKLHADLAANSGESLFDVCDSHSHEMHVLHGLLFDPDGQMLLPDLINAYDVFDSDVLVLDYVLIDPKWRRLKIGLLAARKLIDLLGGGCGLVVSEIAPILREAHTELGVPADWIPESSGREDHEAAVDKLRRYFMPMGFEPLGKSPYHVLSMSRRVPTAAELLRPEPDDGD
jgi:hypothetical protein